MLDRRGFLSSLVIASAVRVGLRPDDATQGVPPRLDCRKGDMGHDIQPYRHGRKLERVVAYDLDEDWADVVRCGPDGQVAIVGDQIATVRLHGGISARWIPKAKV